MEEYSPYKIVHQTQHLTQLKCDIQTVPLQVQIVPSNRCNNRCQFCAYRMKGYPSNEIFEEKDFLSYEKIFECLRDFIEMGVKAVHVTGGGEPLVHPKIYEIFSDILGGGLDLALVTNGLNLNERICELLSEGCWVRVSMDSADESVYSFIRNVPREYFDKVIKNIKLLVKSKKKNIIGIGFVVERENYKEIYNAAKLFKELGVDNFRISAAFTTMGYDYFNGFIEPARELARKAQALSDGSYTVFNLFNDRVRDVFEGVQDYDYCPIKELLAYIGADYNVYTCCTLAYNRKGLIGSIRNQSFRELWESSEKRRMFNEHNPLVDCQFPCMYRNKNEFINYCIKEDPKHINFI